MQFPLANQNMIVCIQAWQTENVPLFLTHFIFFVLIYSANDTIYNMQFYEALQNITICIWQWISDEKIVLIYLQREICKAYRI